MPGPRIAPTTRSTMADTPSGDCQPFMPDSCSAWTVPARRCAANDTCSLRLNSASAPFLITMVANAPALSSIAMRMAFICMVLFMNRCPASAEPNVVVSSLLRPAPMRPVSPLVKSRVMLSISSCERAPTCRT